MLLDQVNLVVGNMGRNVEFYRTLGLDMGEEAPWTDHHRAAMVGGGLDMDLDSTAFAAAWDQGWPRGAPAWSSASRWPTGRRGSGLRDRDNAGYESQQAPFDAFWGALAPSCATRTATPWAS